MRYHLPALRLWMMGVAVICTVPAAAQDMPTVMPNDYVLSDILNRQRVEASIGSRGPTDRKAPARPTPHIAPPAATPASGTTYRASTAVSARVRAQFSQWMTKQTGAEGGRRISEAMQRGDPVRNWAGIVGGDGLRPGDLADSLAAYWILNWVMANGSDSNRTQALAVRAQVRPMILDNPAYARLSNDARQEMSEMLMLNFLIQQAAYSDVMQRSDKVMARRLGEAAAQRFRSEFGIELHALRLTDAGFVPVR